MLTVLLVGGSTSEEAIEREKAAFLQQARSAEGESRV